MPIKEFLVAGFIYFFYSWLVFNPEYKDKAWVYPVGVFCAVIANLIWIYISKITADSSRVIIYGTIWDVIITASTIAVPILMFGTRLSNYAWLGLALIIIGLFILKFSMPH